MADVAPSFKKRTNKSTARKRPATPPPEDSSDTYTSSSDESGHPIKRRKKEGVKVTTAGPQRPQDLSKSTKYSADRTKTITTLDDATKTSNWNTSTSDAAETARATARPQQEAQAEESNGAYKGSANYSSYIQKNPDTSTRQVGPVKAPTNVRTITVTDFAPDVCKDYKQTGFCGFGDSCKFLHAREDYKQGWQLDKEWEKVGSKNTTSSSTSKPGQEDMDDEEKLLESIPFACIICKEPYKMPVVTKCGHYFCEKCAMTRYMKEKKRTCANCGADTAGTFNVARKLKELLEKKRRRVEERRQLQREKGEDVSGDEEEGGG
ncbi:RNA-splicing factor [Saxophila tyrrhenica]|uniref:Pre-mRNA-splicing factor CWC24 n=1 Tax=Saxophila tyrrhenica TaxID=1690608 RepID=A0AAV9PKL5_9PEZI|nr:RNA-splicing factor [Saxophila tyrrhenica]